MRNFRLSISRCLTGALSLTASIRKIVDKIFRNWMFQMIGPVAPVIEEYAIPIALGAMLIVRHVRLESALFRRIRLRLPTIELNPTTQEAAVDREDVICTSQP